MGYRDKFGITEIKNKKYNNLSIGWDFDEMEEEKYPVFLFTPSMADTSNHYHIPLSKVEAKILKDWLDQYFQEDKNT